MRIVAVFFLIVGLYGCKVAPEHDQTPVLLSVEEGGVSKTDVLTQGDEVGVFACIAGTEQYFLEHAQYTVGSDGRTLTCGSTVYYPDRKDAVAFTAYLPFGGTWSGGVGTFSVPSDQSTAAALKQADLCWASARSTPAKSAVPLQFEHKLARLLITTNTPTTKLVAPNVFSGGRLDIKTGVFTNTIQSTITTTGTELILPAQTVTRLILTVSGVEYVFEGAISLEAAKTTSISLTLNPSTKTATFAGVTTTAWGAANKTDAASRTVNNQFTVYWLVADSRFNQINKIGLTIKDQSSGVTKEYLIPQVALVGGSTMASASYTFALANVAELHYPYTVSAIQFYKDALLVHRASVGNVVARTGGATLGSGQNIALTISAATASVTAQVTSSTFALTSNVPYGSSYTTGGASAQGSGLEPPYANRSIVFTYPAQGLVAAAVRTHVMTIAPTVDYTGSPNKRTFTVTQAAVPTALTISAAAPGRNVLRTGETFVINVMANTSWKSQSAVNGVTTVPASGTGSVTGVKVIVPSSVAVATRTVSIDFITTAGLSSITEMTKKWSGTQDIGVPSNAILINKVWWATGSLIANGANDCRIGASTDCGLYFQFGSLIGWSGGAANTNYDGRGAPTTHTATTKVMPSNLNASFNPGAIWPTGGGTAGLSTSYFSVNATPYSTSQTEIWGYNGAPTSGAGVDATRSDLLAGRYAPMGVGDPCRFYLGAPWRLPSVADVSALVGRGLDWGTAMVGSTTDHTTTAWVVVRAGQRLSGPWTYERINTTTWVGGRRPVESVLGECAIFETAAISDATYRIECHWHLKTPNGAYFGGNPSSTFGTRTHGVVVRCVQSL